MGGIWGWDGKNRLELKILENQDLKTWSSLFFACGRYQWQDAQNMLTWYFLRRPPQWKKEWRFRYRLGRSMGYKRPKTYPLSLEARSSLEVRSSPLISFSFWFFCFFLRFFFPFLFLYLMLLCLGCLVCFWWCFVCLFWWWFLCLGPCNTETTGNSGPTL